MLAVLRAYEDDPAVGGFVIVGYGPKAFCAGAEIGRFVDLLGDAPGAAQYSRDSGSLLVHIDGMTKPVVAAVNGMALGGGMELAIRCHDRVATSGAYFQLPEVTLGILPGIGGVAVPFRKWPEHAETFTGMICRAERMKAQDALAAGIVSALEDDYEALVRLAVARVKELKDTLPLAQPSMEGIDLDAIQAQGTVPEGANLSHQVVRIIIEAIVAGTRAPDLAGALEIGYLAFGLVACTAAAKEGIAAFLGGRKPDFTGM